MTREEALKYAKFRLECYSKGNGEYTEHGEFLAAAIKALQEPERKKGRWVEKEKYTFGIMYDCSLCENRILDNGHPWNYCPNCGADMRGDEE